MTSFPPPCDIQHLDHPRCAERILGHQPGHPLGRWPAVWAGLFFSLAWLVPAAGQQDVAEQAVGAAADSSSNTAQWTIPLAGNAFVTAGDHAPRRRDARRWDRAEMVQSIYFHVDRPAELQVSLIASVPAGESEIRASWQDQSATVRLQGQQERTVALGTMEVDQAGYVRVDLQGLSKTGELFADASALEIRSATVDLVLSYVKENEGNRFYWGRRGPSVHLGYLPPAGRTAEWFYSELTVPEGQDPIGSYFMANGFREGYFGMQVNSDDATERRILFSVWSPFATDNPRDIPEDQRIVLLAKGESVYTGEFGNEGSGGQSYLRYPWQAGSTYRFLNRAKPDGRGNTVYTGWFYAPETGKWQLIASFLRPQTDTYLQGIHSFLENFSDRHGWQERSCHYGNQWARDTAGNWFPLEEARFSGDDIARRGYRLDFAGGVVGQQFFLRNGGFFHGDVPLGSRFTRPAHDRQPPQVELERLEGVTAGWEPTRSEP